MVSPFWATESKGKQDEYFKWKKISFCALKKFEFAETKGNSVNNCDSLKFIISLRVAFVSSYHRYQKPSYSTVCVYVCIWYRFDTAVLGVDAMKTEALYS